MDRIFGHRSLICNPISKAVIQKLLRAGYPVAAYECCYSVAFCWITFAFMDASLDLSV